MRWTAILFGVTLLAAGATAGTPEDEVWPTQLKRARVTFSAEPDFETGGVHGNVDFRLRFDRAQLADAVGRVAQPIRITLGQAVLFDGVTTDDLAVVGRDELRATRVREDGEDTLTFDLRRGRARLQLVNAALDGMTETGVWQIPLDVEIGDCTWDEYVEFDLRRPRVWTIRRVRLRSVTIPGAGERNAGSGYVIRSRRQLVELHRRENPVVPADVRARRPRTTWREWVDRVDFRRDMVVAVVAYDAYADVTIDRAGPAPGGYLVRYTERKLPCGTSVPFVNLFPDTITRVVPRATGPFAFRRTVVPPGCN